MYIEIDGHSIYCEVTGTGKPLLLINGLGGDPDNFKALKSNLTGYRTIVYDPPGVGRSSDITCPLRISGHARIAAKVLHSLNIDKAAVLGVSWGGTVAQEMAYLYPNNVSELILVSTTPGPFLVVSPKIFFKRSLKLAFGSKTDWMQTAAITGWTSLLYLKKITNKTLIISGLKDDLILPYNAYLLNMMLPNSKLRMVNSDHWLVVNKAEWLSEQMNEFMHL